MVYSFSTKSLEDEELVKNVKKMCWDKGLNFSNYVVKAIKEKVENDKRRTKN